MALHTQDKRRDEERERRAAAERAAEVRRAAIYPNPNPSPSPNPHPHPHPHPHPKPKPNPLPTQVRTVYEKPGEVLSVHPLPSSAGAGAAAPQAGRY